MVDTAGRIERFNRKYGKRTIEKKAEEAKAADRIFGLLPADLGSDLRALWDEFEAQNTADARFAKAIDRLLPLEAIVRLHV